MSVSDTSLDACCREGASAAYVVRKPHVIGARRQMAPPFATHVGGVYRGAPRNCLTNIPSVHHMQPLTATPTRPPPTAHLQFPSVQSTLQSTIRPGGLQDSYRYARDSYCMCTPIAWEYGRDCCWQPSNLPCGPRYDTLPLHLSASCRTPFEVLLTQPSPGYIHKPSRKSPVICL